MMSRPANTPGEFWDQRYAEDGYVFGHKPNQWMAANTDLFEPGMAALVPGDGDGGPPVKEMMFTEARVREDFEDLLDFEYLVEMKSEIPASERHGGPAVVTRLRGRRKHP